MVDFARLNHIKHAIQTDFDVYTGDEVESKAKCVLRYLGAMKKILELPVAAWDCPTTAAGEIDTERKTKMTWNNGNGQGNGNGGGYGQGGGADDVYGRLNSTRNFGGVRFPYIEGGKHRFAVVIMEEFEGKGNDVKVRIVLRTMESSRHKPGELVTRILSICERPMFPNAPSDGELLVDFVRKLKGEPDGAVMADSLRTLMKARITDQLARGILIDCLGVANKKGNWVDLYWTHVDGQTPEQITALRAQIEREGIPPTGGSSQRGVRPPQQQYQQAPLQPQYAPPQAPPQNPPAGQWGGTGAPAQGVPPGGFLAGVPTNNGGNNGQGGQGGGSSW